MYSAQLPAEGPASGDAQSMFGERMFVLWSTQHTGSLGQPVADDQASESFRFSQSLRMHLQASPWILWIPPEEKGILLVFPWWLTP